MKVSVITPIYNCEKFISDTIESVLNQTYTNWEMILIDDCSSDDSINIARSYASKDERIQVIQLDENSGAAVARNVGIENSKGRFLAFLDGDDIWESNKLEIQVDFMIKKNIGFSFTSYKVISEDGTDLDKDVTVPKNIDYNGLLKNTIIGCLTVMLDKEIVGDIRMPLIRTRQDFATWLSILKRGHIAYGINEALSQYRLVPGSISSNKLKAAKRNWYVYRKIEGLSILKSMYVFSGYTINALYKRRKIKKYK